MSDYGKCLCRIFKKIYNKGNELFKWWFSSYNSLPKALIRAAVYESSPLPALQMLGFAHLSHWSQSVVLFAFLWLLVRLNICSYICWPYFFWNCLFISFTHFPFSWLLICKHLEILWIFTPFLALSLHIFPSRYCFF